jgi:chorismate--pyruvate lyase
MRTLKLTRIDAWRMQPPSHPSPLHPWLTDRGSLTAKLKAHTNAFALQRIAQSRTVPHRDEVRHLGFRRGETAIVREVLLFGDGLPSVFAHSVAHARDVRGAWRGLSKLGAKPLADMLFNDPLVARLPIEYLKIDSRHPLFRKAEAAAGPIPNSVWCRRSVFIKRGRPLLVTEVFVSLPVAP